MLGMTAHKYRSYVYVGQPSSYSLILTAGQVTKPSGGNCDLNEETESTRQKIGQGIYVLQIHSGVNCDHCATSRFSGDEDYTFVRLLCGQSCVNNIVSTQNVACVTIPRATGFIVLCCIAWYCIVLRCIEL